MPSRPAPRAKSAPRRPTPEHPSSGISRIDQPSRRTHGYFVRLDYQKTPTGWRPRLTAFFGDASHGGKRGAWRAAEEWTAKMRKQSRRGTTRAKTAAGSKATAGAKTAAGTRRTAAKRKTSSASKSSSASKRK